MGLVAPNHWLFYGTGGVAITQLHPDFSFVDNRGRAGMGSLNTAKVGYAVGGGVEAPLTGRITVKVDSARRLRQYRGLRLANSLSTSFPAQQFSYSGDMKADIIRAGLNYRLGGPDATSLNDPVLVQNAGLQAAGVLCRVAAGNGRAAVARNRKRRRAAAAARTTRRPRLRRG